MKNAVKTVYKIAKYTIADEVRQKSFIIMFFICILIVFLARGCYQGQYVVNGQMLDLDKTSSSVSAWIFHAINTLSSIIAALLAMRVFRRERSDGMLSSIMSKPVKRSWYVGGKIVGLWILSMLFMFTLHGIVLVVVSFKIKIIMYGYVFASLLFTLNLLFIILTVLFLTLVMPDMMAFLAAIGISAGSSVTDWMYSLYVHHNLFMDALISQQDAGIGAEYTWWKVICYAWPKLSGTQKIASSLINSEIAYAGFASVYPIINVVAYCLIFGTLLFWRFSREDIS